MEQSYLIKFCVLFWSNIDAMAYKQPTNSFLTDLNSGPLRSGSSHNRVLLWVLSWVSDRPPFNVSFPEEGHEGKFLCLLLHRQQPFSFGLTLTASLLPAPTREIRILMEEFRRHPCSACINLHFSIFIFELCMCTMVLGLSSPLGSQNSNSPMWSFPAISSGPFPRPLPFLHGPLFPLSLDLIYFFLPFLL